MEYGLLLLRLVVGLLFAAHGAQKLFGSFGGGGPQGTAAFFASLGYRAPALMALNPNAVYNIYKASLLR